MDLGLFVLPTLSICQNWLPWHPSQISSFFLSSVHGSDGFKRKIREKTDILVSKWSVLLATSDFLVSALEYFLEDKWKKTKTNLSLILTFNWHNCLKQTNPAMGGRSCTRMLITLAANLKIHIG